MRNGRPCGCGCVTCEGYSCSMVTPDTSCDADGNVYISFYEPFDAPLQSGWEVHSVTGVAGKGVPVTGDYLNDYVYGTSGFRDPITCGRLSVSCTVFTDNPNVGYASFGVGGGPYFHIEGSDVTFSLPDTGILVDNSYQSGDRYAAYLGINYIPPGFYTNHIIVYKMRNTAFVCNPPLEGSGVGAGTSARVTPYPTGCGYTECTLYNKVHNNRSGDSVYTLQDPIVAGIQESGSWKFDDFCVHFWDRHGERMLYEGVDVTGVNESLCTCLQTPACDFILDKPTFFWQIPCSILYENGSTSTPCSSGQTPYLMWQAYDDNYLLNTNEWRCDGLIPGSSQFVFLRTETHTSDVDLSSAGIWHIVPMTASETYSCTDNDPFDGSSDCTHVAFTGYPCNEGDCYSYPFGRFDSIFQLHQKCDFTARVGNVYFGSGDCLQVGTVDALGGNLRYPIGGYTIPRDDDYSLVRQYSIFGVGYFLDFDMSPVWKVEKLAYGIDFDETNRWWHGTFRFLGASGSVCPDVGGSGTSPEYFSGKDLGLVYKSGTCQEYDLYLYSPCNLGLSTPVPKIEILSSGNDVFSSRDFTLIGPNEENGTNYCYDITESSAINTTAFRNNNAGFMHCTNGVMSPYGTKIPILEIDRFYNTGPEEDQMICSTGSCVDPSGTYSLTFNGVMGYKLTVPSFDISYAPHYMLDSYGSCVTRDASDVFTGEFYSSVGLIGFGTAYNPNDYPSLTCISVNDAKIYDLIESETPDLMWPATQKPGIVGMSPCMNSSFTNISYWQGAVIGKVSALSSAYDDLGSSTTFELPASGDSGFNYKIQPVNVKMFIDAKNNNLKAFIHYCGTLPNYDSGGNCVLTGESDWYVTPSGFYKSESDILNNRYFAEVTVLSTNPYKVHLRQSFIAMGVPNDGTLETDCTRYKMYPYMAEVTLEEPTII